METSTSHWEIDGPLTFSTPGFGSIEAHGVDLALDREDGALIEVRLTFTIPPEMYPRVDNEGLFNLDPDSRGPGGDTFAPESEVQIEARLETSLLPGVAALGNDIIETGPKFSALMAGSPLLDSESWYALSVTVELLRDAEGGSLREGYSTLHATQDDDFLRLSMLTIASAAFEERGMEWHETNDDEVIRADLIGENGEWACYVVARKRENRCTVYSQAPWETPEPQRGLMAETLTRINFGLPLGNFELDFGDGEIRFKTSLDISGEHLSVQLFDNLLAPNLATMDLYLPALEAVRDGSMTPRAAVEMIES